ncbi:MAG: hypothetical protein IKO57_10645 [Treponema sp.]|nr:hypothetical protein [Treponema sp.]
MNMKRIFLYIMVVLAAALFSCSQLYEDLLVKEDEKHSLSVTSAEISDSEGTKTLTVTTADGVTTSSVVSVDGTECSITGTVTENADGTKTISYDVSSVVTAETLGGTVSVTIRAEGFKDTETTADYTPAVVLTVPEDKDVFNSEASSEEEPTATTNYRDSITVTKTYTASDTTALSSWADVQSFMADSANNGKTISVTFTATADKDSSKTATASVTYTVKKDATIDSVEVTSSANGEFVVGATLTATTYYLDEDNGNAKTEYTGHGVSYQWYIADDSSGTGESAIAGATKNAYTVESSVNGSSPCGKYIYVKATQASTSTTKTSEMKAIKKSVTYVTDIKSGTSETVTYDSSYASLKSDAAKTNRTFVGWYRESNYSGDKVTDSDIAGFADSETLFARWGGAALDISVPVGDGAGKMFKSAYLHIPGVAIADFDDDGFDILSGESAVINNHASIDLSGKKFVDGTETALAGYTAGTSGNMTLRVQMGAVDASSGTNLASTKLIITLVDTDGGWYLTYIDGANFTASATAHIATGSALTAFSHSTTATINGQSYTIATHNAGGYSPEDVGTYHLWSESAPSFAESGFTLPTLADIENFVQDSATVAATSSQITGLHGYTIGGVFFPAGGYRASTTADSTSDNYNCELDYWSGTASTTNMTDFAYSLTGGSDALTTGVWKKDQYFTVRLIQ